MSFKIQAWPLGITFFFLLFFFLLLPLSFLSIFPDFLSLFLAQTVTLNGEGGGCVTILFLFSILFSQKAILKAILINYSPYLLLFTPYLYVFLFFFEFYFTFTFLWCVGRPSQWSKEDFGLHFPNYARLS